jgi:hypothetical protein
MDTLVSFLTLEEIYSVFPPFSTLLAIGLSYIAFNMLRYIPSTPSFFRTFYHEWILNFVRGFFHT